MSNTLWKVTEFVLTSDCICEDWDEDSQTSRPADYCFGCWDTEKENFRLDILDPWLDRNDWDEDTLIYVSSQNMGWNHVAGWTNVRAGEVLDCLTLRGDFTLRFKLDGKTLTCVRSSHDELGARFTFAEAQAEGGY